MTEYLFCFTAYRVRDYGRINPMLSFISIDPSKKYDTWERHMVTSVERAPKSIHHYGVYMNLDEIVPVQFYPRPLTLAKFLGLCHEPRRIDPELWKLLTCKTDKNPMGRQ